MYQQGTTLLIPALNEIEGMKKILPQIDRKWVDQILLVDGGSTDGTQQFARSQGIEVVQQEGKGLLAGYRSAFPHIRHEYVITFSPDGNSRPDTIPTLIKKISQGYELVVASRYLPGGGSDDDTRFTQFGNWLITGLIRMFFRAKCTDSLVMLRIYRTSLIPKLGLLGKKNVDTLWDRLNAWETLSSIRMGKNGLPYGEVPGPEPARIGGKAKIPKIRAGFVCFCVIAHEILFWKTKPDTIPSESPRQTLMEKEA